MDSGELAGKVVLVTGGSRGIGRELVLEAAARGARVAFCARRLGTEAEAVVEEAGRRTGPENVLAVRADISREEDVEALFAAVLGAFGRVDVVVNNAGLTRDFLLVSFPLEAWDEVIATNLTGPFLVSRRAIRAFRAQPVLSEGPGPRPRGTIISIGSVQQNGAPSTACYAASKGGLIGLTRSIAWEEGAHGIRAYLVVVGAVETELIRDIPEAMKRAVREASPQRRPALTGEIASAVLYLASERAGLANGQALYVAGGLREVMG